MDVLKVQTTLRGYNAWIIRRLMEVKREPLADIANYLISRWVDDNAEYLARFDLTPDRYQNEEDLRDKIERPDFSGRGREGE